MPLTAGWHTPIVARFEKCINVASRHLACVGRGERRWHQPSPRLARVMAKSAVTTVSPGVQEKAVACGRRVRMTCCNRDEALIWSPIAHFDGPRGDLRQAVAATARNLDHCVSTYGAPEELREGTRLSRFGEPDGTVSVHDKDCPILANCSSKPTNGLAVRRAHTLHLRGTQRFDRPRLTLDRLKCAHIDSTIRSRSRTEERHPSERMAAGERDEVGGQLPDRLHSIGGKMVHLRESWGERYVAEERAAIEPMARKPRRLNAGAGRQAERGGGEVARAPTDRPLR
eukprot:scaffold201936_cov31-Tisochrysis_lutea.AAC.3